MTPKQREAAKRLADSLEWLLRNRDDPDSYPMSRCKDAAALLRELLEATDAENATVEPVQEPGIEYKRGYEEALNDCIRNGLTWARSMFANNAEHIETKDEQHDLHRRSVEIMSKALDYSARMTEAMERIAAAMQQQRRPLTDEQIDRLDTEAIHGGPDSQYAFRFARAIERAHGITGEPT